MADNLYNIQLLKEFSSEYLNKCFFLTLEDMLYSPPVLKVGPSRIAYSIQQREIHKNVKTAFFFFSQPNFMVFIAELFWWFENVKPDFVQPRDTQESKEGKRNFQNSSSLLYQDCSCNYEFIRILIQGAFPRPT